MNLAISAQRENGSLVLRVVDSGAGLSPLVASGESGGIGLANIRGRLSQLYGPSATLSLENRTSGGVEASLRLPFHISPQPALSLE